VLYKYSSKTTLGRRQSSAAAANHITRIRSRDISQQQ